MLQPTAPRKLTYAEYALIPNDGQRHEVIDGEHFVNPAPSTYHQTVSRRIQFQLYEQIELNGQGQVFDAPIDLQLSEHDIVQPDLVIVLNRDSQIITPTKIKGVPALVVEILSPSNSQHDTVRKRALYLKAKVPEYWIVDPGEHTVDQLLLIDDYSSSRFAVSIQPTVIDGVTVDLQKVW